MSEFIGFGLLYVLIIIGINQISNVFGDKLKSTYNLIKITVLLSTIIYISTIVISFYGISLKGTYTNRILNSGFILVSILYFIIVKNSSTKIIPVIILSVLILFSYFSLITKKIKYEKKINSDLKFQSVNGFSIFNYDDLYLVKSKLWIFEKKLYKIPSSINTVSQIQLIKVDRDTIDFLCFPKRDNNDGYTYEPGTYRLVNTNNKWKSVGY